VTEREELLTTAGTMIHQHPFLGVGLYNFIPAMAPLQKPMPLGLYLQPVHNIFVLATAQTGIIGLGFFIWLLAATMRRIKKHELQIKGMLFVLFLVIFVTGMFDHYWLTLQQGQLLFSTIIGLSWATVKKSA
jgi:O-antigen ligase